jgi:hypothetical protein
MCHLHIQSFGKFGGRISHHFYKGGTNLLIQRPSLHYFRIIDAVHEYFVDSRSLEVVCTEKGE